MISQLPISVEKCDQINFFGLTQGKQIMICMRDRIDGTDLILWPTDKTIPEKYKPSDEGFECITNLREFQLIDRIINKTYIAETLIFEVINNNLEMWKNLYRGGFFPYWNPEKGPYEFNNKKHGQIALCRVYEIDYKINESHIVSANDGNWTHATLIDSSAIENITKLKRRPICLESEYDRLSEKVNEITGNNVAFAHDL